VLRIFIIERQKMGTLHRIEDARSKTTPLLAGAPAVIATARADIVAIKATPAPEVRDDDEGEAAAVSGFFAKKTLPIPGKVLPITPPKIPPTSMVELAETITLRSLRLEECEDMAFTISDLEPDEITDSDRKVIAEAGSIFQHTAPGSTHAFDRLITANIARTERNYLLKAYQLIRNKKLARTNSAENKTVDVRAYVNKHRPLVSKLAQDLVYQMLERPDDRSFLTLAAFAALPYTASRDAATALRKALMDECTTLEASNKLYWKQKKAALICLAERTIDGVKGTPPPIPTQKRFFEKVLAEVWETRKLSPTIIDEVTPANATVEDRDEMSLNDFTLSPTDKALFSAVERFQRAATSSVSSPLHYYDALTHAAAAYPRQAQAFVRLAHIAQPKSAAHANIDQATLETRYANQIKSLALRVVYHKAQEAQDYYTDAALASIPGELSAQNRKHLRTLLVAEIAKLEKIGVKKLLEMERCASDAAFAAVTDPLRHIQLLLDARAQFSSTEEQDVFQHVLHIVKADLATFAEEIKVIKTNSRAEKKSMTTKFHEDIAIKKRSHTLTSAQAANFRALYKLASQDIGSLFAFLEGLPTLDQADKAYVTALARYVALAFDRENKAAIMQKVDKLLYNESMRNQFELALNIAVTHQERLTNFVLATIEQISQNPSHHQEILFEAVRNLQVNDYRDFYSLYDRFKHLIRPRNRPYAPFQAPPEEPNRFEMLTVHGQQAAKLVAKAAPGVTTAAKWLVLAGALAFDSSGIEASSTMKLAPVESVDYSRTPETALLRSFTSSPHSVFMGFNRTGQARAYVVDGPAPQGVEAITAHAGEVVYSPLEFTIEYEPVNVHSALYGFMRRPSFLRAYPQYQAGPRDQSLLLSNATGRLRYIQSHIAMGDKITLGFNAQGNIVISRWRRDATELVSQPIVIDCSRLPNLGNFALNGSAPSRPALQMTPINISPTPTTAYAQLEKEIATTKVVATSVQRATTGWWTEVKQAVSRNLHLTIASSKNLMHRIFRY